MAPIWCFNNLAQEPSTFQSGPNDWVDDFATNVQMGQLNDGDMGYRIFPRFHNDGSANQTQHFVNNNHWMTDSAGGTTNGATLRPNRSFTFEHGKLVVEADVASGITDYGNGTVWPEITISMAPNPTPRIVDSLYAYGAFGGFWTVGCRLHTGGASICAMESAANNIANNQKSCNAEAPSRVMEISDFEICGTTHSGGNRFGDNGTYWRQCQHNQIEAYCFDRFRLELTKSSLTLFVNGHQYFQDAGWDPIHQLPDSMVNGGQVYAYFSDWRSNPKAPAYRFFWERLAVNPHNPDGSLAPPTPSDYFCLGQPQNTCQDELPGGGGTGGQTATPTPTASPSTNPPPTPQDFATSASASASPVARGSAVTLNASVKSTNATTAQVTLDVFDSSGNHVFQKIYTNQAFTAGQTRTYTESWTPAASAPTGRYSIRVGVYASDASFTVK
jgi:hypothetical protein